MFSSFSKEATQRIIYIQNFVEFKTGNKNRIKIEYSSIYLEEIN